MSDWQPIETAPRDGSCILGINSNGDQAVIRWSPPIWVPQFASQDTAGRMWNGEGFGVWNGTATHWQPLPDRP